MINPIFRKEFWDLGHELFQTDPNRFPVSFICGDIFSDTILSINEDENAMSQHTLPSKILRSIHSLTPLIRKINALHVGALFHLFDEETQTILAKRIASLLSREKGSIIFGHHVGRPVKGLRSEASGAGALADRMFCHSDKSWVQLWTSIFPDGGVKAAARLDKMVRDDLRHRDGVNYYELVWCITRL